MKSFLFAAVAVFALLPQASAGQPLRNWNQPVTGDSEKARHKQKEKPKEEIVPGKPASVKKDSAVWASQAAMETYYELLRNGADKAAEARMAKDIASKRAAAIERGTQVHVLEVPRTPREYIGQSGAHLGNGGTMIAFGGEMEGPVRVALDDGTIGWMHCSVLTQKKKKK